MIMIMIKVTLQDKEGKEVTQLSVESDEIVEAACIVYDGKYYLYAGQTGRFFSGIIFKEINPPIHLQKL
jgi:hypothetical protein